MGGAFGATCGLLLMRLLPTWQIQPGLYAMCAAAAMLGGVFRASISLVVIFVESSKVSITCSGPHTYPEWCLFPPHSTNPHVLSCHG